MPQEVDNWLAHQPEANRKRINQIVNALSNGNRAKVQEVICIELMMIEKAAYCRGIRAAAGFASEWDSQISGTKYKFESIILGKFNLISKSAMVVKQR